jgi:hypothetical protein
MAKKQFNAAQQLTLSIAQRKHALDFARNAAQKAQLNLSQFRQLLTYRDRVYIRQVNTTQKQLAAVRANMNGDLSMVQDITVPIAMPHVETAVAYQAGVFLTSYPIFGVAARAADQDAAMQFETTLGKQSQYFNWSRELIKVFRNGFKHNFGPALCEWTRVPTARVVDSLDPQSPMATKIEGGWYGGNAITALDPYNCFVDPIPNPCDLHTKGEFFGYNELVSRISLKRYMMTLDPNRTTNLREAYESTFSAAWGSDGNAMAYYMPEVNRYYANLRRPTQNDGVNWAAWLNMETKVGPGHINYRENYVKTTLFCRACPSDFGQQGNLPAIFKLVIINWQFVVYAEQLVQAHDFLPTVVMQPNEDGLGYQTNSLLDNSSPFQDMASGLWTTTMEGARRQVYDRLVYNPQYINKRDIDPANPTARIPVKNANSLNFDMNRALHRIPYENSNPMLGVQLSGQVTQMADQAVGQNKVAQGQFQKGNKTTTEFETTMDGSNSRSQLCAVSIEGQFFAPVKEMVKSNTLQNQAAESIYSPQQEKQVEIDPVKLRSTILSFDMTDGVLNSEKLLNPNVMQVFFQMAQGMPTLNTEYDIMSMFLYWCKLKGARWVNDFRRNPQQQQQFLGTAAATTAAINPQVPIAQAQAAADAAAAQAQAAAGITAQG